jgi:hypothetical protein
MVFDDAYGRELPHEKNKILDYSKARLFPDYVGNRRFCSEEQPLANEQKDTYPTEVSREIFEQKETKLAKFRPNVDSSLGTLGCALATLVANFSWAKGSLPLLPSFPSVQKSLC